MSVKDQQFKKYEEQGDYHWREAFGGWRRTSPRLRARYEIPVKILKENGRAASAVGLDAGCGDGVMVYLLRRTAARVDGIDASEVAVEIADKRLRNLGVANGEVMVGSCYKIPAPDAHYDFVTAVEVIEHLDAPRQFLSEAHRVLKPGGMFICTTPNRAVTKVVDPYHVQEFVATELADELTRFFGRVRIRSAYPRWLDLAYVEGSGVRVIDLAVRAAVKVLAWVGLNLYARLRAAKAADALLVGVATKSAS
jgi:2-polyprenyl-3-methyl-5-hydroxy-6-metoxy-1,4-benzoquinol methylase